MLQIISERTRSRRVLLREKALPSIARIALRKVELVVLQYPRAVVPSCVYA